MTIKEKIENGKAYLGIEFGSTRIKAVLIDDSFAPVASGDHAWENRYENGVWTYSLDDIHTGLVSSYKSLKKDVKENYGVPLRKIAGIGISEFLFKTFNYYINLFPQLPQNLAPLVGVPQLGQNLGAVPPAICCPPMFMFG